MLLFLKAKGRMSKGYRAVPDTGGTMPRTGKRNGEFLPHFSFFDRARCYITQSIVDLLFNPPFGITDGN